MRPWPWILTALASLVLYPNWWTEVGHVRTLMDPNVFRRRCAASCWRRSRRPTVHDRHAAQLGRLSVVNDFYRRFLRARAASADKIVVSQIVTVGLMLVSIYVTLHSRRSNRREAVIVTGAGTGTVLLLRWFWWRINAWSEVSAMAVAAGVSCTCRSASGGTATSRATSLT